MRTRIISTDIWDEDTVFTLNIDTKLLYFVILTNPYVGQSRFYKINDRQLSTYSGLNVEQIQKCKRDLEDCKMVYFKNGYVCITGYGFVECFYKGAKNELAKQKEISKIPVDVLNHFKKKLDTLSIPYKYPSDTTINNKLEIINTKSEIINNELVSEDIKQESSYTNEFLEFYSLYPRKVGKLGAFKKWKTIIKDVTPQIIKSALQNQIDAKMFDKEQKFIKHPEVWLNKGCWDDEIIKKEDQIKKTKSY